MKIACWFVATLSSIQNGLILAKQDDEATREQGLTHRLRHEIERDLQARIIDGDRVPIDTYVSHCYFVQKLNTRITFAVQNSFC